MKNLKRSILILFIALFIFGCGEEEIEGEDYILKFGSECGWCGGQEYITLTNSKVEYVRNIPCGDEKGVTNNSRSFLDDEWDSLTNSFDYDLFLTLDYSNCNVCVDGCDEIIKITKDGTSHELRYSFSDDVEGMENLRQKLNDIMEEMREKN